MCQIAQSPPPSLGTLLARIFSTDTGSMLSMLEGKRTPAPAGVTINNHNTPDMHIRCHHKDGRTDEYHIGPGERLVVDEDAELELLNPEECDSREPKSEASETRPRGHEDRPTGDNWN